MLAVLLPRIDADDRDAFRRRLATWRIRPRWYILGLTLVPLADGAGVGVTTLWSGIFPLRLERFALLPLFVITNLGEELGWRGYALPPLQRRSSPLASSLILGASWAAFHRVALAQNPTHPWGWVAVGSTTLTAMSVVMTWLFNHTGSVVLMVLLHATYDVVSIGVVPLADTSMPLLAFALNAAALFLLAVILLLIAGRSLADPPKSRGLSQEIVTVPAPPEDAVRASGSLDH